MPAPARQPETSNFRRPGTASLQKNARQTQAFSRKASLSRVVASTGWSHLSAEGWLLCALGRSQSPISFGKPPDPALGVPPPLPSFRCLRGVFFRRPCKARSRKIRQPTAPRVSSSGGRQAGTSPDVRTRRRAGPMPERLSKHAKAPPLP